MQEAQLENYLTFCREMMEKWEVPGLALTIVKDSEIIAQSAWGKENINGSEAAKPASLFPIGSISKGFTATLLGQLVGQRKIDWFDKVIDYLPNFFLYDVTATEDIRIQDLLFHNSGLGLLSSTFLVFIGYSADEVIHRLRFIKPAREFRSQFQYQHSMYLVAGKVIEKVAGRLWHDVLNEQLLKPLKMNNTFARQIDIPKPISNFSPHAILTDTQLQTLSHDFFIINYGPAAGIYSTIQDLSHWLLFNLNNGEFNQQQIITPGALAKIFTPHITISFNPIAPQLVSSFDTRAYGLGWYMFDYCGHQGLEHTGTSPGISSIISFIPKSKIGIAIVANSHAMRGLLTVLKLRFYDLCLKLDVHDYQQELFTEYRLTQQKMQKTRKALMSQHPFEDYIPGRYAGHYRNHFYGDAKIIFDDKYQLYLVIGPNNRQIPLHFLGHDEFIFNANDKLGVAYNGTRLQFGNTLDGCSALFTLQLFIDSGFGELVELSHEVFERVG